MRPISPTSTHPSARAHRHTHTDSYSLLTWGTTQPLTKSLWCVLIFGVYRYEASKDNWDSEAVMCEGRDQMRSSGKASLEEFVLSCISVRKSAVCVFESRGECSYSICQDVDILVSVDGRDNKMC